MFAFDFNSTHQHQESLNSSTIQSLLEVLSVRYRLHYRSKGKWKCEMFYLNTNHALQNATTIIKKLTKNLCCWVKFNSPRSRVSRLDKFPNPSGSTLSPLFPVLEKQWHVNVWDYPSQYILCISNATTTIMFKIHWLSVCFCFQVNSQT